MTFKGRADIHMTGLLNISNGSRKDDDVVYDTRERNSLRSPFTFGTDFPFRFHICPLPLRERGWPACLNCLCTCTYRRGQLQLRFTIEKRQLSKPLHRTTEPSIALSLCRGRTAPCGDRPS